MQKKQFYSHIVETESVVIRLHEMDLKDEEKAHLVSLMESSLHHTILDAILSELSPSDKKLFLSALAQDNHEAIWTFLKEKIDGIEGKIQKVAEDLKKELHEDIDEVHRP